MYLSVLLGSIFQRKILTKREETKRINHKRLFIVNMKNKIRKEYYGQMI